MWMMVMFDLPTDTSEERKNASDFRNFLQKKGFSMAQFSVYFRFTGSREESTKYVRAVKRNAPSVGDICILFFTDKQFGDIIHIKNRKSDSLAQKVTQYELF
ncbi:MAG: CRISPR-associated endonuclease Cas2 [Alphaproteobacteria bacterium]|nr:CRISPR-associated endonuclease Cas2 [Alphaproteobacteria bacterium]